MYEAAIAKPIGQKSVTTSKGCAFLAADVSIDGRPERDEIRLLPRRDRPLMPRMHHQTLWFSDGVGPHYYFAWGCFRYFWSRLSALGGTLPSSEHNKRNAQKHDDHRGCHAAARERKQRRGRTAATLLGDLLFGDGSTG